MKKSTDLTNKIKIEFLSEHRNLIPILAKINYEEWAQFRKNGSVEEMVGRYAETINKNKIPITFVALNHDNALLGFVSLIDNDLSSKPLLTPWLAALYVFPQYRKKGIASELIKVLIQRAEDLGFANVYLYTSNDDRTTFYEKNGFIKQEEFDNDGESCVLKKRQCVLELNK